MLPSSAVQTQKASSALIEEELLFGVGAQFIADDTKRRNGSAMAWPSMISEKLSDGQKNCIRLGEQKSCTKASGHGQPTGTS
ncbi:hypothetical protein AC578_10756 [Pseudocercospora eumusae]|uniref:Uncharacterized protein n=1 Tax=Pseudocercospora eumusae TaxID=321146 RepID=A0A139GZU5_9PEZI|nr:hypothetical protein AC578_10756 [Pseudocercospora eumusae]